MPSYTLRQLECFVAVADHATIAKAAKALHLSPSAVSAAVDEVERYLGARLTVRRRAHGVTLTVAGRDLLPGARRLLEAARDLAPAADGKLRGRIAVGCYGTLAAALLPTLIEGFETLHPGVRMTFLEGSQEVLSEALEEGRLDAAILYDRDIRSDFATRDLCALRPHALLAADHPLADRPSVSLRELADEPLVLFDLQPAWQNTQALMEAAGVRPRIRYVTKDHELARSLVGRGLGYAVLVQRPATSRTHEGKQVVVKELTPAPAPISIVLAWPQASPPTSIVRAFLDWAPERVRAWRAENNVEPASKSSR